jgi:hypothetical protein
VTLNTECGLVEQFEAPLWQLDFEQASGLKPHLFHMFYGMAEAVPHKDWAVATQVLKRVLLDRATSQRQTYCA